MIDLAKQKHANTLANGNKLKFEMKSIEEIADIQLPENEKYDIIYRYTHRLSCFYCLSTSIYQPISLS